MADHYDPKQVSDRATNYRSIIADSATGELAWLKPLRSRKRMGIRDGGPQYVEEGQYKAWESADYFSEDQPFQSLPEDNANTAVLLGQTPSASVLLRKKYFRSLAAFAGWTRAFQEAMTTLMMNKAVDIASVEMLTKFKHIYGVRAENDGALTRNIKDDDLVGKDINHYRAYWYGNNVGNYPGGVLEITNFTSVNTSASVITGDLGSCSITIEDPYNLLYVSKADIDRLFDNQFQPQTDNSRKRYELQKQIDALNSQKNKILSVSKASESQKKQPGCPTDAERYQKIQDLKKAKSDLAGKLNALKLRLDTIQNDLAGGQESYELEILAQELPKQVKTDEAILSDYNKQITVLEQCDPRLSPHPQETTGSIVSQKTAIVDNTRKSISILQSKLNDPDISVSDKVNLQSTIDNMNTLLAEQTAELEAAKKSAVSSGPSRLSESDKASVSNIDKQVSALQTELDSIPLDPIAKLKSGMEIFYKRDVDYLYQFVCGRSIFTVMDDIYVWMSPVKEDLFQFNVVNDLIARYNELLGMRKKVDPIQQSQANQTKKASDDKKSLQNAQSATDKQIADWKQEWSTLDRDQKNMAESIAYMQSNIEANTWYDKTDNHPGYDTTWLPTPKDYETFMNPSGIPGAGINTKDPAWQAAIIRYRSAYKALDGANQKFDAISSRKKELDDKISKATADSEKAASSGTSGASTASKRENVSNAQSAKNRAVLDAARQFSIQEEMDDIAARLKMFGYSVDKDGSIKPGDPGINKEFTGFELTSGLQVFCGLINNVTEAWSDGVFTINISASNVFKFLEMSRFAPQGGSVLDAFGLMDSPVAFLKEGDKIRWHWLWGTRAMSGHKPSSQNTESIETGYSIDDLTTASTGIDIKQNAFNALDAGNLISQILCGIVFDPTQQLTISIPDSAHEYFRSSVSSLSMTPVEGERYIATQRRLLETTNRVFGNFVPFAWVPPDILAYETEIYDDVLYSTVLSDPRQDSQIGAGQKSGLLKDSVVYGAGVSDTNGKQYVRSVGKVTNESNAVMNDRWQLSAYIRMLETEKASINSASYDSSNQTYSVSVKSDWLDKEINYMKERWSEAAGASGVPKYSFRVSDVVLDYPSVRSNESPDDMIAKCLDYSDAQQFILLNRKRDILRNIDEKYVVIDMTYMASLVARAFTFKIPNSPSMWNSDRTTQMQMFKEIVAQLDWEGFADTQGNIIYRKRQYNRIPASVYKRHIAPYAKNFVDNVLASKYSGDLQKWLNAPISETERQEQMVKYLPGISPTWVLVYQNSFLRAQLLEPDYPIDIASSSDYVKELLNEPMKEDPRADKVRYHNYIMDENILGWNLSENENQMCRVNIQGSLDFGIDEKLRTSIATALTAAAVDYDMWYHYGYKPESLIKAWIRDDLVQGVPYALSVLAQAKSKVMSGTITVVGSPYYQPGEVVYIESRNMLYYVTRVSHNFSYGSEFKTTLTLEYGHYPGAWISDPYYISQTAFLNGYQQYTLGSLAGHQKSLAIKKEIMNPKLTAQLFAQGQAQEASTVPGNSVLTGQTAMNPSSAALRDGAKQITNQQVPTIEATFDPEIVDRLRAAKFYDWGTQSNNSAQLDTTRGLDYNKIRRPDGDSK